MVVPSLAIKEKIILFCKAICYVNKPTEYTSPEIALDKVQADAILFIDVSKQLGEASVLNVIPPSQLIHYS